MKKNEKVSGRYLSGPPDLRYPEHPASCLPDLSYPAHQISVIRSTGSPLSGAAYRVPESGRISIWWCTPSSNKRKILDTDADLSICSRIAAIHQPVQEGRQIGIHLEEHDHGLLTLVVDVYILTSQQQVQQAVDLPLLCKLAQVKTRSAAEHGQHGLQRRELKLGAGAVGTVGGPSVEAEYLAETAGPAGKQVEEVLAQLFADECATFVEREGEHQLLDETLK